MFLCIGLVLSLGFLVAPSSQATCSGAARKCTGSGSCSIPNPKMLTCNVPCDNVNNRFTVQSITATQLGQSVDVDQGLWLNVPLILTITGTDNYGGPVANPKIDVNLYSCSKGFFTPCGWQLYPTLNLLKNLDPCDASSGISIPDCHLSNTQLTQIVVTVDLSKNSALSGILPLVPRNRDYELEVILKDGSSPLMCAIASDWLLPNKG